MVYESWMSRTHGSRSHAPAHLLMLTGAILSAGCIGDLFPGSASSAPAARSAPGPMVDLWDLAPTDAVAGVVVRDGALGRVLSMVADPSPSPARAVFEEQVQKRSGLPFDPLSPEAWAGAGLDPRKGAAAFSFADKKRGALLVLPVIDRALFRRAFAIPTRLVDGREVDQLDDETLCEPAAGHYLCARSLGAIAAAAALHAAPLAESVRELDDHGDVELYLSRDAPGVSHFNHEGSSAGWVTALTGTIRLRDDGATLHAHAHGSLATPAARGFYAGRPPPELQAAAEGAPTVARIHVDPAAIVSPTADIEPEVRSELIEQLTGDIEIVPSGSGFANATMILPLHDAARVEAFVKDRCAEEAARKERRPIGGFTVEAHGCAAVIDTSKAVLLLQFPQVKARATVEGGRLLITLGDPAKHPPRAAASGGAAGAAVDGEAAKRAIEGAETLLFFTHNLGIGPEVGAGALFRAAIPIFGERVAAAAEAWNYASAHLSQGLVEARVTDEDFDLTLELTSFAADPPAAREAYGAALAKRFAGDDAGYRAALAAIEHGFPGTRAARRAAEVQRGDPFCGAGVALTATLGMMGNATKKK
jgi:hypothetical protein